MKKEREKNEEGRREYKMMDEMKLHIIQWWTKGNSVKLKRMMKTKTIENNWIEENIIQWWIY